jgi:hypothetical protein
MKTYNFEMWADYVRGLTSPELTQEMLSTLASGDRANQRLFELASGVANASSWLKAPDVPRDTVQRAVALFTPVETESLFQLPAIAMQLVFDSLRQPMTQGLRAQGELCRETIHEADGYQLSVRLEHEPGTDFVAVVGQLLPNETESRSVAHRPVFVFSKDKLVARTISSGSGEFQMAFPSRSPLRLVLTLDNPERRIELPLDSAAGSRRGGGPSKSSF